MEIHISFQRRNRLFAHALKTFLNNRYGEELVIELYVDGERQYDSYTVFDTYNHKVIDFYLVDSYEQISPWIFVEIGLSQARKRPFIILSLQDKFASYVSFPIK